MKKFIEALKVGGMFFGVMAIISGSCCCLPIIEDLFHGNIQKITMDAQLLILVPMLSSAWGVFAFFAVLLDIGKRKEYSLN